MATFAEHSENIQKLAHVHVQKVAEAQHCRVTAENREEMAQSIYDHMLRNQIVERYDPTIGTKLSTYLYSQIYWLAVNEITDFIDLHSHEVSVGDSPYMESRPDPNPEIITDPYITHALQYCVEQLRSNYPPNKSRDFAWLLSTLVEQVERDGDANLSDIARQLKVSREAVRLQVKALQQLPPVRQFWVALKGDRYRAHEPLYTRVDPNYVLA